MPPINSLKEVHKAAKKKPAKKLIVAGAGYKELLRALKQACDENLVIPVLVGDKKEIIRLAKSLNFDLRKIEIYDITDQDHAQACQTAVDLIHSKQGDILMKGMVSTAAFLKPIINNETGLLNNRLLSHFALFESPYYHKLLGIADVAINIAPDFTEKLDILKNSVEIFHKLGITSPKVAVLAAVETINPKMEATIHAAMFTLMNRRNQLTGCQVEGPLAIDNAISKDAAGSKGIQGDVAGDADFLLAPDLNSGNILYKSLNFLGAATSASVVAGASVPIVLTSRADSETSKLMSIALAVLTS